MLRILPQPVQSVALVLKYSPDQPREKGRWVSAFGSSTPTRGHTSAAQMRAEPLPTTLGAAEDRIRGEANEHAFIVKDGKPFMVLGNDDSHAVQLGEATEADLKDAVLTHNHPSGMGLSQQDAFTAQKRNVLGMRAVTATGTHSIQRTGPEWPPDFFQSVTAMHEAVKDELGKRIDAGVMSIDEANAIHHQTLYSRLQKQLRGSFIYKFEPHES